MDSSLGRAANILADVTRASGLFTLFGGGAAKFTTKACPSGNIPAANVTTGGGAIDAPVGVTVPGERFVRVGKGPENLKFTFETPGGTQAGTYAFPEQTFNQIGRSPQALKNFGDLPGAPPQYFRILEPPPGTPIQRGIVPGGQYGGRGGVPEVFFPQGW